LLETITLLRNALSLYPLIFGEGIGEYIPFGEAIDSEWIPFSTNRRLKKWLKEATQALGSTGSIPYHPDYIPEAIVAAEVADLEAAISQRLGSANDAIEASEAAGLAAEGEIVKIETI
jgi:hypothetical protein